MGNADHSERFTRRELHDWLKARGAKCVGQRGSHIHWVLPNGRALLTQDPANHVEVVPTFQAKQIAAAMGLALIDLRAQLGRTPNPNATKAKPVDRRPLSRHHAEMANDVRRAAGVMLKRGILPAQRDYMTTHLPAILKDIERMAR